MKRKAKKLKKKLVRIRRAIKNIAVDLGVEQLKLYELHVVVLAIAALMEYFGLGWGGKHEEKPMMVVMQEKRDDEKQRDNVSTAANGNAPPVIRARLLLR